ncbi:hypothetical protein SAMN06296386_1077 [Lachnospiraceae bacterium]|nr:hypothetical protein SAMN06296386_1077 [Lachnospiraceae bacterium]
MDVSVKNCKECGHLFQYPGFGDRICPDCKKIEDRAFQRVKDFLYDYPGATLYITAETCEVAPERIRKWLREERLQFVEITGTGLSCDHCGKPLTSGRFCADCKYRFALAAGTAREYTEEAQEKAEKEKETNSGAKMFFLGRNRRGR